MSGMKRKADLEESLENDFDASKRCKPSHQRSNVEAVYGSGPLKRKNADVDQELKSAKRRMGSGSFTDGSTQTDTHQLIKPRLKFPLIGPYRVFVNIRVTMEEEYSRRPPILSSGTLLPILTITAPPESINTVLSSLYEAEGQMCPSGGYEVDSVLGFFRAIKGDFTWPVNDLAVDKKAIVDAISQVKYTRALMGSSI